MGRTIPSAMMKFQEIESNWKKFRRALRREDQVLFDELIIKSRKHVSALAYASLTFPIEGMFMSMLLEQQKEIRKLKESLDRPKFSDQAHC